MMANSLARLKGIRWWHSPAALTAFFVMPFFILLAMVTPAVIRTAPVLQSHRVYVTFENVVQGVSLLLALMVGAFLTERFPFRRKLVIRNRALDFLFYMTLAAYLIWFGPLIVLHPNVIMATMSASRGAMYEVREAAPNISGITTATQFGIAYAIIYGMKVFQDGQKIPRRYHRMLWGIIALAVFRAVVFSERIAIVEVVVPLFAVYATSKAPRARITDLGFRFFPYLLYAGAPIFFAIFEYPRSWINHYINIYDNFWHFIADRFTLYYATSINNICALLRYSPNPTFRGEWTLNWLYKFPVIGQLLPTRPATKDGSWFLSFLSVYATPEYNNTTGILTVIYDWGWLIGIFLMIIYGAIAGISYSSLKSGLGPMRYIYPVFLYSMLEMTRIGYIYDGRAVSVLIGILVCAVVWGKWMPANPKLPRKAKASGPMPPRAVALNAASQV
ncbi:O-antigen polymerase [Novosphingobium sp. BL-8H]|uniref:O-antigen polymerase n=1 Tax=Novosphingobium sp. BL-8H TaxID=3127640 RepID=UPI00375767E3